MGEEEDALDKVEPESSVMKVYARSILERLREELSGKCTTKLWLLETLKTSSWRLRAKCASDVMAKLQPASDPSAWPNPFYLRDIFIWLPEERWGEKPCCPTCDSNSDIHSHDYQLAWPTRRCFEQAHILLLRARSAPRAPPPRRSHPPPSSTARATHPLHPILSPPHRILTPPHPIPTPPKPHHHTTQSSPRGEDWVG
jgi:hypothetical protein